MRPPSSLNASTKHRMTPDACALRAATLVACAARRVFECDDNLERLPCPFPGDS